MFYDVAQQLHVAHEIIEGGDSKFTPRYLLIIVDDLPKTMAIETAILLLHPAKLIPHWLPDKIIKSAN